MSKILGVYDYRNGVECGSLDENKKQEIKQRT